MRLHGRLHFVLGGFQFLLKRVPFIVLGEFVNAVAAAENVFTDTERFRHFNDVSSSVLHLLTILSLDRDEAICDQTAKVHGDLRTIAIGGWKRTPKLPGPIWLTWFSQCGEKSARRRNADGFIPHRLGELIRRQARGLSGGDGQRGEQKDAAI